MSVFCFKWHLLLNQATAAELAAPLIDGVQTQDGHTVLAVCVCVGVNLVFCPGCTYFELLEISLYEMRVIWRECVLRDAAYASCYSYICPVSELLWSLEGMHVICCRTKKVLASCFDFSNGNKLILNLHCLNIQIDMLIRLIGNSKLAVGLDVRVNSSLSQCYWSYSKLTTCSGHTPPLFPWQLGWAPASPHDPVG